MDGAAEQTESYSPAQVDAMYDAIQSGKTAQDGLRAIDGGGEKTPAPTKAQPEPAAFEKRIKWNGQEIVVNDPSKYDTWAQQGYDYSQRMSQLNAEREQFQRTQAENSEKYNRYAEIDAYVAQDPNWWKHVEEQWARRDQNALAQGLGINPMEMAPELKQVLDPVLAELTELKKFYNDVQKQKIEQTQAEEDRKYFEEVAGLQKQFPEFDFQAKGQSGQTLEAEIVKFANERQIPSFSAAFYAYYQPNLQKIYESRGRKAAEAELVKRKQEGIISESETPQTSQNQAQASTNIGRKSYNDLAREALIELGLR